MKKYWAAESPSEISKKIASKVEAFDRYLQETGRLKLCQRAINTYYGFDPDGGWSRSSAISFGGDQGETVLLHANHFRSLVDSRGIQVTGQRPNFEAMAENNDWEAADECRLAEGIFEYHLAKKGLEDRTKEAVKRLGVTGEGWISLLWDPHGGRAYTVDPETQQPVTTGEVTARVFSMYDVVRDITRDDPDHQWLITRRHVNKWDLAAKYPEHAEELINMTRQVDLQHALRISIERKTYGIDDDCVELRELFHDKTPAMPEGRLVLCVENVVLFDGPLPYEKLPIYCIAEDMEPDAPFGHTKNWDMIGPQQALNSAFSTLLTNHDAYGVQNVIVPHGSDLEVQDVSRGLRMIKVNMTVGKPEPLQFLQPGEASYKLLGLAVETMETLSGVNATARGNPQASLKSGSALALVQSMSVQANSGLAGAYIRFLEEIGSALVKLYQTFATAPQLIEIAGVDKRSSVKTFLQDDIKRVSRVVVSVGGPLMRTQAGRLEVAGELASRWPNVITPEQYMMVMETGRLEPIYQSRIAEPMYIHRESQMLSEGQEMAVTWMEDHAAHIAEHKVLLFDPSIRENPQLVSLIMGHIAEHQSILMQQKHAEMGTPAPGGPPSPQGPQAPAKGPGDGPSEVFQNTSGKPADVLMPMNPLSGQRSSPTGVNSGPSQ